MFASFLSRTRSFVVFVLLAGMSTVTMASIYATVQQSYRSNANDPQIEASEAIAEALHGDVPPDAIVGQNDPLDISKTLSLFIILFDREGKVVGSSGKLGNSTPTPPKGVFDFAKNHSDDRFTWEPQKGVRIAAIVRKVEGDKGFVLVGRNLREVELREKQTLQMSAIAWVALLILSALLAKVLSSPGDENLTLVEETNILEVTPKSDDNQQSLI